MYCLGVTVPRPRSTISAPDRRFSRARSLVGSSSLSPLTNTTSAWESVTAALGGGSNVCESAPSGIRPLICTRSPPTLATMLVIGETVVTTRRRSPDDPAAIACVVPPLPPQPERPSARVAAIASPAIPPPKRAEPSPRSPTGVPSRDALALATGSLLELRADEPHFTFFAAAPAQSLRRSRRTGRLEGADVIRQLGRDLDGERGVAEVRVGPRLR